LKLALDHHYSPAIARQLRAGGHDVVGAIEPTWEALDDEALLEACHREERALLTNNVADFAIIARRWAPQGRRHHGLIFTSDASMPRSRNTISRYVTRLDALLTLYPRPDAMLDQIHWL
jgi:hypothetical protein